MSNLSIKRTLAVPTAPYDASTMYIVKDASDANLAQLYFSNADGSAIRHLLDKADVAAMIGSATAATADELTTARTISASGDASWQVTFDGSANATAVLTLSTTGVTAGDYAVVTVDAKGRVTHGRALTAADIPQLDVSKIDGAVAATQKGVAGGVATLDSNGLIPTSQLPGFVDDVLEFDDQVSFPATGATDKLYVALDTNLVYRWSGSTYVMIVAGGGISDEALKLHTARTLSGSGDAVFSLLFDGSANVSTTVTLSNTGITAGEHIVTTFDAKGRATGARDLVESDIPTLTSNVVASSAAVTLAASEW